MTLYKFDATKKGLQPVPTTTFQDASIHENKHLQEVLANNIALLDEDLLVIAREYGKWMESQKRIDILALDRKGCLVVVELKRTTNDKQVDLQAIRYAGMISVMSHNEIVTTYAEYLKDIGSDKDAKSELDSFLENNLEGTLLGENVRILIVAQNFFDEVVATIFWLNTQGLDISCVKMTPYMNGDEVLVDIIKFIPLPEAREWQEKYKRKESEKSEKSKRDWTRYDVSAGTEVVSEHAPKNRTMLAVMKRLIEKHGIGPDALKEQFTQYTGGDLFYIQDNRKSAPDFIAKMIEGKRSRYFTGEDDLIFHEGKTMAVSSQWGGESFDAAVGVINSKYSKHLKVTKSDKS